MKNETQKLLPPASNKNFCAYQKEKDAARNVRGALKLEASTSTPLTLAGEEISIYVVIRNPFLVPVIIQSTETHIPVSLVDELGKKRYKKRLKENRKKEIKSIGKEDKKTELKVNTIDPIDAKIKVSSPRKNYFLV